jgi:putative redox protein
MEVVLKRMNDAVLFEAANEDGVTISIDGSEKIGGTKAGFRPMQLVLAALAGCVSMDVVSILKKQRADLEALSITSKGERNEKAVPSPFTKIHLHFAFSGNLDPAKTEKTVGMVVEKYCSVGEMLKATVEITFSVSVDAGDANA